MTTSKQRPSMAISRTDALTFQQNKGAAFVQAVNRAANLKILVAIKSGKLRIVAPPKQMQNIARYTPRMDVIDDPSSSTLSAIFEIPGIKTENIKLWVREGELTLYGERRAPYPTRTEPYSENPLPTINALALEDGMDQDPPSRVKVHVQEICFGTFQRTIPIPKGVKIHDITANLSDGMLTVTWPRSPVQTIDEVPRSARSQKSNSSSPPMPMVAAGTASQ